MPLFSVKKRDDVAIESAIRRKRLQIMIHACLYYEFNYTIWSDSQYDKVSRELAQLQRDNQDISKKVRFYKEFKDWGETSSGFNLPLKRPNLLKKAELLKRLHEEG